MNRKIRYDAEREAILVPCVLRGTYEVEREQISTRAGIDRVTEDFSYKAWLTPSDVAEVRRIALELLATE